MSYILDALKKSHQARRRGSVTASRESVPRIAPSFPDNGLWFTGGIILLMGVTAVVLLFWRNASDQLHVPSPGKTANEAVVQPAANSIMNEMPRLVLPEKTAASTALVRDLAEEARVSDLADVAASQKARVVKPNNKSESGNVKPKMNSIPPISRVSDEILQLEQMPAEFQHALPRLAVTIHVYSPQESQRILFINNREYHKGDHITADISVDEIVPDGVVLSFRGDKFKLGRPR